MCCTLDQGTDHNFECQKIESYVQSIEIIYKIAWVLKVKEINHHEETYSAYKS